ncbi:hypothetical protein BGZ76_002817 [Entomortierella beljakovae]|nr:hypothetical protein BGZ76_002817 [Entomortierella beljakovae]
MSITPSELTAYDKVFALPEICDRISHWIDDKTKTSCICVNRVWNASWLPILWHTIDAGPHWRDTAFQDALGRHGDLIRILKCSRYDEIDLLFRTDSAICTNLRTLVLPKSTPTNHYIHSRLLRQNPNIRDLSCFFLDSTPISSYTDLISTFDDLPYLTRLALDENKIIDATTLETILTKCNGTLLELSLKGTYFIQHPFKSGEEFASGLMAFSETRPQPGVELRTTDAAAESKPTFGIQHLSLEGVTCSQDLILNLASRFPLLSRLSLQETSEVYFSKDFAERLAKRSPKIKHFDISETEDADDDTIARIIGSFPGIQTFRASETRFGDNSLRALVDCCRNLTVLEIVSTCPIKGQVIQQLFERCWSLKRLDAWDVTANVAEMMVEAYGSDVAVGVSGAKTLDKTDGSAAETIPSYVANQGQWVCREIESLALRFDYDSSTLSEDDQLYSTPSARRFIYQQLSRLTKLKHLVIGGAILDSVDTDGDEDGEECKDSYKNTEAVTKGIHRFALDDEVPFDASSSIWIDFSLGSGLALLGSLENLHTLSISNHTIGVQEIIWMTKSWPNLRMIEGLDEDDDEPVIDWLYQNRPDIKLESDY